MTCRCACPSIGPEVVRPSYRSNQLCFAASLKYQQLNEGTSMGQDQYISQAAIYECNNEGGEGGGAEGHSALLSANIFQGTGRGSQ